MIVILIKVIQCRKQEVLPTGRYLAVVDIKILIPSFLTEKVHNTTLALIEIVHLLICDHFPATDTNRSKNSATKEYGEPFLPL